MVWKTTTLIHLIVTTNLKKISSVAEVAGEEKPDGYKVVFRNISNPQNESYFPFLEALRSL